MIISKELHLSESKNLENYFLETKRSVCNTQNQDQSAGMFGMLSTIVLFSKIIYYWLFRCILFASECFISS